MGFWDFMFPKYNEAVMASAQNPEPFTFETPPRRTFSSGTPTLIGSDYETWNALVGHAHTGFRISRNEALQVPALKSARDIFCHQIGTLPIHTYNGKGEAQDHSLLQQPERYKGLVRSVTMIKTIDDLFFHSSSLWVVRDRYADPTFPRVVERPDFSRWVQDSETGQIMVDGEKVPTDDCILFVSGNEPMLEFGGPLRALLVLEQLAGAYLARPEATEIFQPNDGQEHDTEEIEDFLSDYIASRKAGTSAFIPEGINRIEPKRMTAEELQLIAAREFSISEVSRLTGINPSWLALNITSRTYNNAQDERRQFVEGPASPYIKAIEERLSVGDVTPRGQYVKFNLDGYLRANTLERYQAHNLAITGGWKTVNEVRKLEDLTPIAGGDELKNPTPPPAASTGAPQ